MDAPELAALSLLEHAIEVARIAVLAQHFELNDPDAPFRREPQPNTDVTGVFFTRAQALAVAVRRYRAALTPVEPGDGAAASDARLADDS